MRGLRGGGRRGWCEALSGPGAARTILLFHTISARPSKQPRMVGSTPGVYSSFGLDFVSARTNKRHHHHEALGIQYRWVLTRGPLGSALVTAEDLVINDAKGESWMPAAVHEIEGDLLEDCHTVCRRIVSLWSEFSDAFAVFDKHGPDQLLCAQQVRESPLDAFPLRHKPLQTC